MQNSSNECYKHQNQPLRDINEHKDTQVDLDYALLKPVDNTDHNVSKPAQHPPLAVTSASDVIKHSDINLSLREKKQSDFGNDASDLMAKKVLLK